MTDIRRDMVIKTWKTVHTGRQLELVFWRPPYFLDRRVKAYQKGVGGIEQARMISSRV